MEGVGGELGGVALGRGETADCGVDGVDVDESSVEDGGAIDRLSDGGRCRLGGSTPLGVEGDAFDAAIGDQERNAR